MQASGVETLQFLTWNLSSVPSDIYIGIYLDGSGISDEDTEVTVYQLDKAKTTRDLKRYMQSGQCVYRYVF